jgi:ubiquinol-cytochrome c reductase cytochrome c1 subunit
LSLAGIAGTCAALWYTSSNVFAFGYVEECLNPPKYPWEHDKLWKSYDHAAIRRGFTVYNTIGAACHSMRHRFYRQLVDVAFTEDEMKEIAADYDDYDAEPDDEGDVHKRPGVINDRFHIPYANDKQARAANNGALPLDLSQIIRARDAGENYVFSLLMGYRDAPHGVILGENMQYNLYFPGCQIAMPPPLAEGAVTFEDGTEASISQQAKDVTIFLTWSAYMEHDERHLMGIKSLSCFALVCLPVFYWKRFRWSYIKKRGVDFLRRKT